MGRSWSVSSASNKCCSDFLEGPSQIHMSRLTAVWYLRHLIPAQTPTWPQRDRDTHNLPFHAVHELAKVLHRRVRGILHGHQVVQAVIHLHCRRLKASCLQGLFSQDVNHGLTMRCMKVLPNASSFAVHSLVEATRRHIQFDLDEASNPVERPLSHISPLFSFLHSSLSLHDLHLKL